MAHARAAGEQDFDLPLREVVAVDAGVVLRHHHPETEVAGCEGGVLPARALAVVLPPDDRVASLVAHLHGLAGGRHPIVRHVHGAGADEAGEDEEQEG